MLVAGLSKATIIVAGYAEAKDNRRRCTPEAGAKPAA
jgi:hypothetical protein